jgi:hypothetical protein
MRLVDVTASSVTFCVAIGALAGGLLSGPESDASVGIQNPVKSKSDTVFLAAVKLLRW